MAANGEKPLEGWLAIAHNQGKSVRTVQRWRAKGLPVHHHELLGLIAYPSELRAWRELFDQRNDSETESIFNQPGISALGNLPHEVVNGDPLIDEGLDDLICDVGSRIEGTESATPSSENSVTLPLPRPARSLLPQESTPDAISGQTAPQLRNQLSFERQSASDSPLADSVAPAPMPIHSPWLRWRVLIIVCAVAAVAVYSLWIFHLPIDKSSGSGDIQVTGITRITNDGHLKGPPIAVDGSAVYFTEFSRNMTDDDRKQAVVQLQNQPTVVFPAMPSQGLFLLSAVRGGLHLYTDWRNSDRLVLQRRSGDPILPIEGTGAEARLSPDGSCVAVNLKSILTIRNLRNGSQTTVELPGLTHAITWRSDGTALWAIAQDPVTEINSMWQVGRDGRGTKRLPFSFSVGAHIDPGSWTTDGQTFVFSQTRGIREFQDLWAITADGSGGWRPPAQITSSINLSYPLVAGDSAIIAIGNTFHDESAHYDVSRREFMPAFGGIPAADVAFSHDGRFAAYIIFPDLTLWVSNADGSSPRQMTRQPFAAYQPHWSPDDAEISFMARMPSDSWRDYVMPAAGGAFHEIAPNYPLEQGPATWSRNGRYMVFGELQNRRGRGAMELHLLDLIHNVPTVLPDSSGKWNPRWSPDGRFILATSSDFGSLWVFTCATSGWRRLAQMSKINSPEWSSDSKFIQFAAFAEGKLGIFRIFADSGQLQRVADLPQDDNYVSLSLAPDNSAITLRQVRTDEIYRIDWKRSAQSFPR